MQIKVEQPSKTEATLTIIPSADELTSIKTHVLSHFQTRVKVPGFRPGNVPPAVLEKNVDPNMLQTEFLEEALEQLYVQAVRSKKLKPVDRPQVKINKFVPFTTLEFEVSVPVVGTLKLADYKKIRIAKKPVNITAHDIDEVIKSLQLRTAEKKDVDRPAKAGDEVYIDFKGVNAKGEAVNGAEGKNYPLVLGSGTFIPGFEDNIVGLAANDEKKFTLTFPKDYGVKALANKKVTFTVNVTKVQEVKKPKADDMFAAKVGPFKTLADLRADIKKQVAIEWQNEADRAFESEIIAAVSANSTVEIPEVLINDQLERMERDERQNLLYRGQTWEEHLKEEGLTEEQHRENKRQEATERVKASLLLAEVAEAEELQVMPEELDIRMQALKSQYQDPQMQEELNKPETKRDIAGRLLTEKTLERLVGYATSK